MTGVELPGLDRLPSGPRRELTEALHELYEAAGRPGLRKIADAVREGEYRDTVSHEKVSAMLKGKDSPRWSKWECVVRQLAVWTSPRRDPEVEASLFLKLWQSADHPAGECAVYASTSASASQAPPHPPRSMSIPEQTSTLLTAAQQLAQHGVDQYERGRRDASDFAPHLDYPAYEELARADFDVRAWITPWRHGVQDIAVGRAPSRARLASWWPKAEEYLGALADPIGFDRSSFTPPDLYVDGFADALRELWMAAQEQIAADRQKPPEQTRETPPYVDSGDTSSAIAARLTDLFRGHEGLDLEEVESLGMVFLHRLHEAFDQHIDALHLPDSIRVTLDWKLGASCTYWDQPYRPIHTAGPTALVITADARQPAPVHAELTPFPGIARDQAAEYGLIAIDANRPNGDSLLLKISEMHPAVTDEASRRIAEWVGVRVSDLLNTVKTGMLDARAQRGYQT